MKRLLKRVVIALAALVLATLLAAAIATQLIDVDDYRSEVAAALSQRLALDVQIEGGLSFVPSLRPTLSVKGLYLYHPDREQWQRPVASFGELSLMADGLASLLSRKLVLSSARIHDADLLLIRRLDGSADWQIPEDVTAPEPVVETDDFRLQVEGVEVRDLAIRYEGGPSGLTFTVELDKLDLVAASTTPPRRVEMLVEGRYESEDFAIHGDVEWDEDAPLLVAHGEHRLNVEGRLSETSIRVIGSLWDPRRDARASLRVVVRAEKLPPLKRRLGIMDALDLTGLGPAELVAQLHGGEGQVRLDPVTLYVRGEHNETLRADGSVEDLVSDRRLRADLRIETHDSSRWAERFGLPTPSLVNGYGAAAVELHAGAFRMDEIDVSTQHRDGARVQLEGSLVHADGDWTGDVGVHVQADSGGQALYLVDETIRRLKHEDRAPGTLPGGYPLTATDLALLRIGPATLETRFIGERGGWAMRGLALRAGEEGADWLSVQGDLNRVIPDLAGVDLRLAASTDDLVALGDRIGADVPKIDQLRASGRLHGDPDDLMLDELQIVGARGDRLSIGLSGGVALQQDLTATELELAVSARDLAEVGAVFDRPLWQAGPVELRAQVRGGPDHLYARAIDLRLAESRLTGDLALTRGEERPRLEATLASELIRLGDFGLEPKPEEGTEEPAPAVETEAVDVWHEPLPIRTFGDIDSRLVLTADRIVGRRGLEIENLSFRGSLDEGGARVADLGMTWDGGRVYATAEVDGRVSPPAGSLRAWVDGAEVRRVVAQFTRKELGHGVVDLRVDVRARGESLAAMLSAVDGDLVLYGRDGTLAGRYSRALQLELVPRHQKDPELGDFERVNCLIAHLEAEQGRIALESVLFDTPEQQVLASGLIDLQTQRLDVVLTPAFKQTVPGRVTAAIRVRGPLDDFRATPQPLATAGLAGQAIAERALRPVRRWLPPVGAAIDEARRGTDRAIGATGMPLQSQLWVPGVDISCDKFLAQESVAQALAAEPSAPDSGL